MYRKERKVAIREISCRQKQTKKVNVMTKLSRKEEEEETDQRTITHLVEVVQV